MSVDLYVAVPAASWPTAAAMQECLVDRAYPIRLKRFPAPDKGRVVDGGTLVTIDHAENAYLEGAIAPAKLAEEDVGDINERIALSPDTFRIGNDDLLMSIRTRSPAEMRAASYVVSALIVCFDAYGFEPQGNTHGRQDFADSLVSSAELLKGL